MILHVSKAGDKAPDAASAPPNTAALPDEKKKNKKKNKKKKKKTGASDPPKPAKPLKIEREQDISPDHVYAWFYDVPNPYTMLYALLLLIGSVACVMFPMYKLNHYKAEVSLMN